MIKALLRAGLVVAALVGYGSTAIAADYTIRAHCIAAAVLLQGKRSRSTGGREGSKFASPKTIT